MLAAPLPCPSLPGLCCGGYVTLSSLPVICIVPGYQDLTWHHLEMSLRDIQARTFHYRKTFWPEGLDKAPPDLHFGFTSVQNELVFWWLLQYAEGPSETHSLGKWNALPNAQGFNIQEFGGRESKNFAAKFLLLFGNLNVPSSAHFLTTLFLLWKQTNPERKERAKQ